MRLLRRFQEADSGQFPIEAYARVRVKGVASKLRVKHDDDSFGYGMELLLGDATMQIEMTIHGDVIESHIGKRSANQCY